MISPSQHSDTIVTSLAKKILHPAQQLPHVIVFLDYDGTLAPLTADPLQAILKPEQREYLLQVLKQKAFEMVIVSGRPRDFLKEQVGFLPVSIAAEHGAYFRRLGEPNWKEFVDQQIVSSIDGVASLFEPFVSRVAGSFIERKECSVAWHYRLAHSLPANIVEEIKTTLHAALPPELELCFGHFVFEIRARNISKGTLAKWYLENFLPRGKGIRLLSIGDDVTDEDMFRVVHERGGSTVRVGEGDTSAEYKLATPTDVYLLLGELAYELSGN